MTWTRRWPRPATRAPACPERRIHTGLAAALDVDLGHSPLTNTLPVRRLGLREAGRATPSTVEVAWVLLPSLEVRAEHADATRSRTGPGPLRQRLVHRRASPSTPSGFVTHYPGLAERVPRRRNPADLPFARAGLPRRRSKPVAAEVAGAPTSCDHRVPQTAAAPKKDDP